ncbi:MAG: NADH-quinone oxidoreductase subunit K [Acidiphilium sp. 37-64-53]|uniref:NADH-quinone oxidoreductase subunit NuoK n=1 Tax=Acidiphilium TaxID=522 RepID=UPI000BC4C8CB|nr:MULTISPECIES: NADH-quinone oxidoreductase subunit NuoK [Acidiphilium]OYW03486.1 MAG: NADH-quinone oxidoreductase subunit K [Acidiphilium sp. 37-64-53]OZB30682.1 MAG: NADH-quinone oxidoreductase subunit K [Acidiphilium sp. 34-64-41]HQT84784.1 NADH-quinone oxidoreductase subunit NuoK [Acidiphilium rubrum]
MVSLSWHAPATLAAMLFIIGLIGLLARRSLIFVLMSIEIMLNAAGLLFITAGMRWGNPQGQIMFIFVINLAGAELALGLILLLRLRNRLTTLDGDAANRLRDAQA